LKQSDLGTSSTNFIPTVTTIIPSTMATSLAPKAPTAITLTMSTISTSEIGTTGEKVAKLVQAMEEFPYKT